MILPWVLHFKPFKDVIHSRVPLVENWVPAKVLLLYCKLEYFAAHVQRKK